MKAPRWNDCVEVFGGGEFEYRELGKLRWKRKYKNAPTAQGLTYLVGVGFDNAITSKLSTWTAGLIDNVGFTTGLSINDQLGSHSGWAEFTSYTGNRPTWANSVGGPIIASSGPFSYSITASGVIKGMFIVSNGGLVLWATALLSSQAVVAVGGTLTGTYSVQLVGS